MKPLGISFNQAISDIHMKDSATQLAGLLETEIDNEIMSNMLVAVGWHKINMVVAATIPTSDWFIKNIRYPYRLFHHCCCFKDDKDAAWFALKWG